MELAPLWMCTACGRTFANRNQSHACGRHDLDAHFAGKPDSIRRLFDQFVAEVRKIGPVELVPEKTRIAFHVRMSFAQLTPKRGWIDGHLVLAERRESPLFRKIVTYSPRNHVHEFRLKTPADLTPDLLGCLAEAYAVGEQRHLSRINREGRKRP